MFAFAFFLFFAFIIQNSAKGEKAMCWILFFVGFKLIVCIQFRWKGWGFICLHVSLRRKFNCAQQTKVFKLEIIFYFYVFSTEIFHFHPPSRCSLCWMFKLLMWLRKFVLSGWKLNSNNKLIKTCSGFCERKSRLGTSTFEAWCVPWFSYLCSWCIVSGSCNPQNK